MKVERRTPWVIGFGADGSAMRRLFCFPYAGGGASTYRRFAQCAPAGTEICAVQLPGREDRFSDPPFKSLSAMVRALAPALAPHFDRPFSFFGHSMGALIAFELARELRGQPGMPSPDHLFVSGRRAPHLPGRRRAMHPLSGAEFWNDVRGLQGTPAEVLADRELMDLVEPTLRADFEVCETYACGDEAPLTLPITALGGSDDPEATREELDAWREHTARFGGVRMFPGHHFYLQSQWETVAEVVADASARPPAA